MMWSTQFSSDGASPESWALMGESLGATQASLRAEKEMDLAELESRMRKHTLELMQPTVRKASLLEREVAVLREEFGRSQLMVAELGRTSAKVDLQVQAVERFREELSRWDAERRAVSAHVTELMSATRLDMESFRSSIERQDSAIQSVQRTVDRVVGELTVVQQGSDALGQQVEQRLAHQGQVLNGAKTDLELKMIAQETKLDRLGDELWAEETGLAKANAELTLTSKLAQQLRDDVQRQQKEKADLTQLAHLQHEVTVLLNEANGNFATVKKTVDAMMLDVKEHFETATNTVVSHNAIILSEVRDSYQDDLARSSKFRDEIAGLVAESKAGFQRLEQRFQEASAGSTELMKTVQGNVEEISKLRRRDKGNQDLDTKIMREQLDKVRNSSEHVGRCLEHLTSVMGIILQCERAASALDVQDDSDRAKIALIGYRDAGSASLHAPVRARSRGKGAPEAKSHSRSGRDSALNPVITVDQRCLSCSGQAESVLAGFKMACLQYAPGPVSFSKKVFARGDLLGLREKLLDQANEALQHGPVQGSKRETPRDRLLLSRASASASQESPATDAGRPSSASSSDSSRTKRTNGSGLRMPQLTARAARTAQ